MDTLKKRYYKHFAFYTLFLAFCLMVIPLGGGPRSRDFLQERLYMAMEEYGYNQWRSDVSGVIPGVPTPGKILEILEGIPKVWKNDDYSIERIPGEAYVNVIIRKLWAQGANKLDATMTVCPTFKLAKKYLIFQYASTQMEPMIAKPVGSTLGLKIGDICFATPGKKEGSFSSIDFIRCNVVIMMRAEGSLQDKLKKMAAIMDTELNVPGKKKASYSQLQGIPRITLPEKLVEMQPEIKLGTSLSLDLKVEKLLPGQFDETRYFWRLTGGGVDEDSSGNFHYYGGDLGEQTITVTTVNELGLHDSKTLKIKVIQ